MSAKSTSKAKLVRYKSVEDLPKASPLSRKLKSMSDSEIERAVASDTDATYVTKDFWQNAAVLEPEGTEQITLRLPRRVLKHFRATGKGYQSRISAVLQSYVDAMRKSG